MQKHLALTRPHEVVLPLGTFTPWVCPVQPVLAGKVAKTKDVAWIYGLDSSRMQIGIELNRLHYA